MTENEKALEKRIELLEAEVKDIKQQGNNNANNLTAIKKDVEYTATNVKELKDDFKKYMQTLDDLKLQPGKRWESLIGYITASGIGALITYIATHIVT